MSAERQAPPTMPNPIAALGTSLHDPADIARWRERGWWGTDDLAAFLAQSCARHADRIAVVGITAAERADPDRRATATARRLTYRELGNAATSGARLLADAGVQPGDAIVLHLPNTVDFVMGLAAVVRLGAVPVFALHTQREPGLARLSAGAGAHWILASPERRPLEPQALAEACTELGIAAPTIVPFAAEELSTSGAPDVPLPAADSAAVGVIQLSGGTTGASKLIPRTHAGYIYTTGLQAEVSGLDGESALLVVLPAAHNFPVTSPGILGTWHVGAAVVMCHDPSPATAFGMIAEHRVTHLSLVPPLAQAWIDAAARRPLANSSVRVVGIGGARLAETVARQVEPVLGGTLQQIYGMAEGLANFTRLDDPDEVRFGTQGRPVSPGDEIRIVDRSGSDVAAGAEGELQTRGPYTITRYLGTSAREQASFTEDGYYCTGDLVRLRSDGNIVVTGRAGDTINRAGETLSAQVIEEEALAHPSVVDAVAVGVPDDHLGEALALAVTLRASTGVEQGSGSTEVERLDVREYLRAKGLPAHMLPDVIVVRDSLPVTGVGKNSRRDLRERVADTVAAELRARRHSL